MRNPYLLYGLIGFGAAAILTVVLWWLFDWSPLITWLCAINPITLIIYRFDKSIAGSDRTRVPEWILHLLTLSGGTIGAAVAMWMFPKRHKTNKTEFRIIFFAIVALQIVLLIGYFGFFS